MRVGRAANDRDVIPEFRAESVEFAALMLGAEKGGSLEQFVLNGDGGAPPQLGVEIPQQGVFAAGRGGEIRCAVNDPVSGDEHSCNCR
jgi:hypothetical protein